MGATDVWMTVDGSKTETEVRKAVADRGRQDAFEHGHDGYSGSWAEIAGVNFISTVFDDRTKAEETIMERAQKRGPAFAARVRLADMTKLEKSIRYQNLKKQINEAQRELNINFHQLTVAKRRSAQKKIDALRVRLREKEAEAASKNGKVVWLVGGWAAE